MRATAALLKEALRLTFFTRPNCSLCTEAKEVLAKTWDRRPFAYDEINVMASGGEKWRALYEFDTPVVHIDVNSGTETTSAARKLMHRFREHELRSAMDEVAEDAK